MKYLWGWVLIVSCGMARATSDVVHFKNGDQLTGELAQVQEGKLSFKSDNLGLVEIPVEKVDRYSNQEPVVALLKGGRAVRGKLSLDPSGEWRLEASGASLSLEKKTLVAIYPLKVYEPHNPDRRTRPWKSWKGSGSLGYSLARGDNSAGSLAVGLNATRRRPDLPGLAERLRTNYSLQVLLANTTTPAGLRASAASASTTLRQDFLFSQQNFVFALGQIEHIDAQSLNLRQTYGMGLGRDLIRTSRAAISFLGGTTWVTARFVTGDHEENAEGLVGEKLSLLLFDRLGLEHHLSFFPSMTDAGQYRLETVSALRMPIARRLSFDTGITDRYLSQPLVGHKKNDLVLTMGLGFHF